MSTPEYLLDNRAADAGQRFGALAALFNRTTFSHMTALGIGDGWRCWEIGAGGPSVASWMRERVGPNGHVLATDIDVSWIDAQDDAGFEVRRHDVAHDDPPEGGFDLIHARLVLVHVAGRDEALRRIAGALRPGGWLLIEDFDINLQPHASLGEPTPAVELADKIHQGFRELLEQRGVDRSFGRSLPRRLRGLGLQEVAADAYFPVSLHASALLALANIRQIRAQLVQQNLATDKEIDSHLTAVESGEVEIITPPLVSAWGRRP
jgi:SAM-dependent methyltransferase